MALLIKSTLIVLMVHLGLFFPTLRALLIKWSIGRQLKLLMKKLRRSLQRGKQNVFKYLAKELSNTKIYYSFEPYFQVKGSSWLYMIWELLVTYVRITIQLTLLLICLTHFYSQTVEYVLE